MRYVGDVGDYSRMKSEFRDSSIVTRAKEMVDAGVIHRVMAGNSTSKNKQNGIIQIMITIGIPSSTGHFGDRSINQQFGYNVMPNDPIDLFPPTCWSRLGDPRHLTLQLSQVDPSAYVLNGTDRNGVVSGNNATVTINRGDTVIDVTAQDILSTKNPQTTGTQISVTSGIWTNCASR